MKILVTGCNGFVASNLIKELMKKGHKVYCTSRNKNCSLKKKIYHIIYDLSKKLEISSLPKKIDVIYHIAATMNKNISPEQMLTINTLSTYELLNYAEKSGADYFIFTSSAAVYGYKSKWSKEDIPLNPIGTYGLSKYLSESIIQLYRKKIKNIFILRLAFPYGKGQKRGLIPLLINKIKSKEKVDIFNPETSQKINPVRIKDVAEVLCNCLGLKGYKIANIAGDQVITVRNLTVRLGELLKEKVKFNYIRNKTVSNLLVDNQKMKEIFKIKPSNMNLEDVVL